MKCDICNKEFNSNSSYYSLNNHYVCIDCASTKTMLTIMDNIGIELVEPMIVDASFAIVE